MINIDVTLAGTNGAGATATPANQLSLLSAQSFTALLSEALSETLSKFGIDPNSIKLTVQGQASQTPVTSQNAAVGQSAAVSPIGAASLTAAASMSPPVTSATAAVAATASSTANSATST